MALHMELHTVWDMGRDMCKAWRKGLGMDMDMHTVLGRGKDMHKE